MARRKRLTPGDKVQTVMGCRRKGVVLSRHVSREEWTDGTYSHKPGDIPVQWDDGTKGMWSPIVLKIVE